VLYSVTVRDPVEAPLDEAATDEAALDEPGVAMTVGVTVVYSVTVTRTVERSLVGVGVAGQM
jgi:uncharacterized membrane protein